MTKTKRRFVTLVELLLVITVLLMVAGLVAINIRRAFFEQRFRTEVSAVVDTLRLAQDLMLLLNSDVHVLFAGDPKGGIKFWIDVEKPLSGTWEKELKRKRPNLTAIHAVEMDDRTSDIKVKDQLDIKFLSGGSIMSKGVLSLYSDENKDREGVLKSFICLPGYPQPIQSSTLETKLEDCMSPKEAEEVEQLTRDMLSEIQPRLQKNAQAIEASSKPPDGKKDKSGGKPPP